MPTLAGFYGHKNFMKIREDLANISKYGCIEFSKQKKERLIKFTKMFMLPKIVLLKILRDILMLKGHAGLSGATKSTRV